MVRAYVGWRRYDTEEELKVIDRLLKLISVRHNFFMPQMKLIQKERQNGKVKKSYEIDIPINRVFKLDCIPEDKKQRLIKLRNSIDIVWLSKEIERLTEALSIVYEKKLRRLNHGKI
ncbi:MAG: hypothetical protein QXL51_03080 [Candidatus Aenigmatarchaeota archaeon]